MALDLPPLPNGQPIADQRGLPTLAFSVYWQKMLGLLEAQEALQDQAIADIQAALALGASNAALTQALIAAGSGSVPAGSNGGTSASVSSFASFNAITHAVVTSELSVVAGTGGTVTLTASDLVVTTAAVAPAGVFGVFGKWQWDSTGGGVWVDVGTEDASSPNTEVEDFGGGSYGVSPGLLTVNEIKSGLVAASTHKFRLMARKSSGTRVMNLTGTASAVGS